MTAALRIDQGVHDGLACLWLDAGGPRVAVTSEVGPRVVSVSLPDGTGDGLLASLPGLTIDTPGQAPFRMHGGHRLWAAPEVPASTYLPDDDPPAIERSATQVAFSAFGPAGLRKTMRVAPTSDSVVIDHVLANEGAASLEAAPWAITMLTPGGEAWLPRWLHPSDPGGYQANGSLVLWPYTRLTDPRLVLDHPIIRVRAIAGSEGRVKVGLQGRVGWAAYRRADALLVKHVSWTDGARYVDLDASIQCYCSGDFIEVESLGPLVTLAPGESTTHRETWTLVRVDPDAPTDQILADMGLAEGR